jgi:SagB-type dehydrogenase family enzyme
MRGTEFIEYTTYGENPVSTDQMKGVDPPEIEEPAIGDLIELPDPSRDCAREFDLSEAIELRESIRDYNGEHLTMSELSYLLWCTAGIKWVFEESAFRTVPSAGCRHAIDTYLAINRVDGVKPGLYRYIALDHSLECLPEYPDLAEDVSAACFDQPCIKNAAVVFIWAANAYRMTWKYGDRGYRNLFLDAGHICQNLYLAVQAVGCGTCAVGAFKDQEINDIINLDGKEKFVLYTAAVGKHTLVED